MAITNYERIGKALELLKAGLGPYIDREIQSSIKDGSFSSQGLTYFIEDPLLKDKTLDQWDAAALIKLMWDAWNAVFKKTLGHAERSLVSEIRDVRNKWAHQGQFTSDDADRALDSITRLLTAVSAPEADEVGKMKQELRRLIFDEQVRSEKRKAGGSLIESTVSGSIKPWREVVTPHVDVASGRYQQAEFAADLWQVYMGEGSDEYRNPVEFFRRTYLTESLKRLLAGSVLRMNGKGGDPVLQLQTNFGGGKTHAMLALFHLFSGAEPGSLAGIDALLAETGNPTLSKANRVVIVGNKISPGNPVTKKDGTVIRTIWGEIAYQLGGLQAFSRIAADDEKATCPGDVLRELFNEYGPCLILIDEWVAYARQLHDHSDLPGGTFETQFTFAQALTEAARATKNCLVVISLPASFMAGARQSQVDDVEVGGLRGRDALDRLRNVIGRVESSWTPATAEEGFEIVRRRLFEPLSGPDQYKQRDVTARAFADLYRAQSAEFPTECKNADYEKRIQAAFPIHPEIFDRLYTDWATLVKFQRTRGVLRLMASVIHSLWEKGDHNPLILPSTIPIDDSRVRDELTRYLSDNWKPIIEKDVDGPGSLPLKIDGDVPNLGKLHATRRVARTIYLGSAPIADAAHQGIEDRQVKLGCVMPGESPAVFGDALRRLAASATYLYQDGPRVWYSTQPTVTKLADDRAELLKRDPDKVAQELEKRVRADLRKTGDFARIHPFPRSGADVPDDMDARLVVLGPEYPYSKELDNPATIMAKSILENRGNTPRLYRNALVFLVPDKVRLQDLDEALRKYLAWESILDEKEALNLAPYHVKQAETQKRSADSAVTARLPETYFLLLAPAQSNPQSPIEWQTPKASGGEPLAVRASKKLRSDESLVMSLGATILRKHMDAVPLWRGNHVSIRQLADDFARYIYLPRLSNPSVLIKTVRDGLSLLTWQMDTFGYAEGYDEAANRYLGLRCGSSITLNLDDNGLLVNPDIAKKQIDAETQKIQTDTKSSDPQPLLEPDSSAILSPPVFITEEPKLCRFHGTVQLNPERVGRDASIIAEEVIAHLKGIVGAEVYVTLEIEAVIPEGTPGNVVRIVTENSRTLKFESQGFEEE